MSDLCCSSGDYVLDLLASILVEVMRKLGIDGKGLLYRQNDIAGKVGNSCH